MARVGRTDRIQRQVGFQFDETEHQFAIARHSHAFEQRQRGQRGGVRVRVVQPADAVAASARALRARRAATDTRPRESAFCQQRHRLFAQCARGTVVERVPPDGPPPLGYPGRQSGDGIGNGKDRHAAFGSICIMPKMLPSVSLP